MLPFFFFFFFFFSLLFLSQTSTHSCHKPISSSEHNRRVLHQPLFPLPTSSPPSPSPSLPPSSPTISFTKFPFSTNPTTFFPFFTPPSPPPPSTTTAPPVLPTYPANVTSLILPTSQNGLKKPSTAKKAVVTVSVVVPVFGVAVLGTVCFFLIYRRRQRRCLQLPEKSVLSDNRRLFPPNTRTSDGQKISGGASTTTTDISSSDFLYMGAVVNSRSGGGGVGSDTTTLDETSGGGGSARVRSPYRKLGSPELRPLPPLWKHSGMVYVNAEGGCSSDEEYYSPRESAMEKEKGRLSSDTTPDRSRRVSSEPMVSVEKLQTHVPDMYSSSYPSSNSISSPTPPSSPSPRSSHQMSSSVGRSSPQSPSFGSENLTVLKDNVGTVVPCPPPPPPPPPVLQPHIPPLTQSHLLSTLERDSDINHKVSAFSSQNLMRDEEDRKNTFFSESAALSGAPPPLPPPPPPLGHWESKSPMMAEPPNLFPPLSDGLKTSAPSSFFHAESPKTSNDTATKNDETFRPKLKPLHWDKVRASSDCAMVWDQLRSSSFQLNEEMIETLFICDPMNNVLSRIGKRQVPLTKSQENRVLDPKKSQNIAILLRALNVSKEEVCESLLEGNTDSLGAELLETLMKMAPSKEEEINLKEYKDDTPFKLGPAENFLKAVLDIPFAFKRVDAMLYTTNFDSEVSYLKNSFETIKAACEELRKSRMFMKLLEAVLKTGNRMNIGTYRGDAHAFKLDTLLKLVDVKGTDGKTTLLHFVVQEIIRAEGSRLSVAKQTHQSNGEPQMDSLRDDLELKKLGLQAVAGLSGELSNVKKAAAMDSDVLSSYVLKLAAGVRKVSEVINLSLKYGCSEESDQMFQESMSGFMRKAKDEIIKIQSLETAALLLVTEITEYFHGNSAREEAHPFRIFMVVRDFLSNLDLVCKEVGKINNRSSLSSARQFPVLADTTQPSIFPSFQPQQRASGSSEDDNDGTSSSSS